MASLRRLPRSPNFIACFTGADGKRYQRSTGIRVDGKAQTRRKAQRTADEFEDVAKKRKTVTQIQRVIREIYDDAYGEALPNSTYNLFTERWLVSKKPEVSESTYRSYQGKINSFTTFLGTRADQAISDITTEDLRRWRDQEADRVSASTVNLGIKLLRVFFGSAKKEGLTADNPAALVQPLKRKPTTQRRPFTVPEVQSLIKNADEEWSSMILFGFYTGQRLGDIAQLTWSQIDLDNREIKLTTTKTGRHQNIPIPPTLLSHLKALDKPKTIDTPIHPRAYSILENTGRSGTLSLQFNAIMAKAGIIEKTKHRETAAAPGRSGKRKGSQISFHSLRHTTTSLLKNAGISPAIAEEFVGHDSAEMNRTYTHIELESMRKAADSLPDVT